MPEIPIDGGFYLSDSLPVSAQRLINAYVNFPQTQTNSQANLFGTPGLVELVSVSDIDTLRGAHELAGLPYFVIGNTLYRLDRTVGATTTWAAIDLGTIDGEGPVSIDDNGTQLCVVVPGVAAYVYDTGTTMLTEITDANFDGPASSVIFIDQYFNFIKTDGKKFFNSPLGDGRGSPYGTAYDPLDFNVADADPDNIVGQVNYGSKLYMLGKQTTQGFTNIGRTPSPFAPDRGSVIDIGLFAPFSIQKTQNTFYMVGGGVNESPAIWQFTGNGYKKVSTTAVDTLLNGLTDDEVQNITSWSYAKKGAYFVGWSLPDTCIVYDQASKRWHERQSWFDDGEQTYRAAGMITAYGEILVGDLRNGTIGQLDEDIYTEYGELIRRTFVGRFFDNQGESVTVNRLEAIMETGVGNSDVEDPQLRLSWTDDGGRTFTEERSRSFGKVGEYTSRAVWWRNGSFPRSRALRFRYSEPSKFVFVKLEADFA